MPTLFRGKSAEYKVILVLVAVIIILAAVLGPVLSLGGQAAAQSAPLDWRRIATARGDRFPDFSFAGYHASNMSLPAADSAPKVTLQTSGKDQTRQIQQALNQTASAGGGVVLLGEGNFTISSGIFVPSNVTLRGSGSARTMIVSTEEGPTEPIITLGTPESGRGPVDELARANILDEYVPIGTAVLNVDNATGFAVGQTVMVNRAVTAEWVRANGMADLVRDGVQQTWIEPGKLVQHPSIIASIAGNQINLTIPLTDSLDAEYMSPYLTAYTPPQPASEIGIEQLSLSLATSCSGTAVSNSTCNAAAISFPSWTVDSWARDLTLQNFNTFISVAYNASRITLQNVAMYRDADVTGVALPADISITGSQVLVQDCAQQGIPAARSFAVMTGSLAPGPNAVRRHITRSTSQSIYPHQRWATGMLVEDTDVAVLFVNRGIKGSGHGWSMNAGVGWNLRGPASFESPPLGVNWCVGYTGVGGAGAKGNGTFIESGFSVSPESLFQAQLEARGL
ncbi:hypothetical protein Micbo1qcDRAFT_219203 [Microdochium bolleyi]|uniref:Rhamnogalacturonase A/B/Epimerase-like pectate lyase domain-containing protein n=1 Tax=Microdochium bolleyi TaxID=196109 RepID=A0A136INV9_9PEZI|nr:hypothetical protein Micbo1qcDRAFT_219203 [Microdochium bolleyi]